MEFLLTLGPLNGLSLDQKDFYNAAKSGNKKILKKLIDSGRIYDIDMKNEQGQTPLFYACAEGQDDCVKFLLDKGANPNEPTENGQTPLHAACYQACIKSVGALVERGGDFRFHDKEQRTAKDWAMLNPNAKRRQMMTEYIVKTRMFAMTHSGRDVLLEQQSSMYMRRPSDNVGSMAHLFKRLSSKGSGRGEQLRASASLMSLGYGKVYGGEKGGTISTIPMVAESMLKHDDFGTTFMNSAYFVMEGMMFGATKVTVKRLHHDPPTGGVVDHLIRECENIAHLRHTNVLLLMATCATDNMEGMVLIFERISFGSLYNYLHEKNQQPAQHAIIEAGLQVCEGLIYIHQNNFLHNYMSSHSLFLSNCNSMKIGNFEYMVPVTVGGKAARLPGITNNKYLNAAYNWMPPETIKGELPTDRSDIYGFCAVMWEMFTGFIPWAGHDAEQIERQVCNNKMLKVNDSQVPTKFADVLNYGLQPSAANRKMNLEQMRDVLCLLPRGQRKSGKAAPSASIAQSNNHCSPDVYGTACSSFGYQSSAKEYHSTRAKRPRSRKKCHPDVRNQPLRCNHQTQTSTEQKMSSYDTERVSNPYGTPGLTELLPPPRTKHQSVPVLNGSMASEDTSLADRRRQHAAEQRLRLSLALKAPLHEELKTYYAEVKRDLADSTPKDGGDTAYPPEESDSVCAQQLTLQRELNKELLTVFSQFDDEQFGRLDLTQFDESPTAAAGNDSPAAPSNSVVEDLKPVIAQLTGRAAGGKEVLRPGNPSKETTPIPSVTHSHSFSVLGRANHSSHLTAVDRAKSSVDIRRDVSPSSISPTNAARDLVMPVKPAGHSTGGQLSSRSSSSTSGFHHSLPLTHHSSLPCGKRSKVSRQRNGRSFSKPVFSRRNEYSPLEENEIPSIQNIIKASSIPSANPLGTVTSSPRPVDKSYLEFPHRQQIEPYQIISASWRAVEEQPPHKSHTISEDTESSTLAMLSKAASPHRSACMTDQRVADGSQGESAKMERLQSQTDRVALRYLDKGGAITEQVPVVDRIKRLEKPYMQCKNNAIAQRIRENSVSRHSDKSSRTQSPSYIPNSAESTKPVPMAAHCCRRGPKQPRGGHVNAGSGKLAGISDSRNRSSPDQRKQKLQATPVGSELQCWTGASVDANKTEHDNSIAAVGAQRMQSHTDPPVTMDTAPNAETSDSKSVRSYVSQLEKQFGTDLSQGSSSRNSRADIQKLSLKDNYVENANHSQSSSLAALSHSQGCNRMGTPTNHSVSPSCSLGSNLMGTTSHSQLSTRVDTPSLSQRSKRVESRSYLQRANRLDSHSFSQKTNRVDSPSYSPRDTHTSKHGIHTRSSSFSGSASLSSISDQSMDRLATTSIHDKISSFQTLTSSHEKRQSALGGYGRPEASGNLGTPKESCHSPQSNSSVEQSRACADVMFTHLARTQRAPTRSPPDVVNKTDIFMRGRRRGPALRAGHWRLNAGEHEANSVATEDTVCSSSRSGSRDPPSGDRSTRETALTPPPPYMHARGIQALPADAGADDVRMPAPVAEPAEFSPTYLPMSYYASSTTDAAAGSSTPEGLADDVLDREISDCEQRLSSINYTDSVERLQQALQGESTPPALSTHLGVTAGLFPGHNSPTRSPETGSSTGLAANAKTTGEESCMVLCDDVSSVGESLQSAATIEPAVAVVLEPTLELAVRNTADVKVNVDVVDAQLLAEVRVDTVDCLTCWTPSEVAAATTVWVPVAVATEIVDEIVARVPITVSDGIFPRAQLTTCGPAEVVAEVPSWTPADVVAEIVDEMVARVPAERSDGIAFWVLSQLFDRITGSETADATDSTASWSAALAAPHIIGEMADESLADIAEVVNADTAEGVNDEDAAKRRFLTDEGEGDSEVAETPSCSELGSSLRLPLSSSVNQLSAHGTHPAEPLTATLRTPADRSPTFSGDDDDCCDSTVLPSPVIPRLYCDPLVVGVYDTADADAVATASTCSLPPSQVSPSSTRYMTPDTGTPRLDVEGNPRFFTPHDSPRDVNSSTDTSMDEPSPDVVHVSGDEEVMDTNLRLDENNNDAQASASPGYAGVCKTRPASYAVVKETEHGGILPAEVSTRLGQVGRTLGETCAVLDICSVLSPAGYGAGETLFSHNKLVEAGLISASTELPTGTVGGCRVSEDIAEPHEHTMELCEDYEHGEAMASAEESEGTGGLDEATGGFREVTDSLHDVTEGLDKVTGGLHEVTGDLDEVTRSLDEVSGSLNEVTESQHEVTGGQHEVTGGQHEVTESLHEVTARLNEHMVELNEEGDGRFEVDMIETVESVDTVTLHQLLDTSPHALDNSGAPVEDDHRPPGDSMNLANSLVLPNTTGFPSSITEPTSTAVGPPSDHVSSDEVENQHCFEIRGDGRGPRIDTLGPRIGSHEHAEKATEREANDAATLLSEPVTLNRAEGGTLVRCNLQTESSDTQLEEQRKIEIVCASGRLSPPVTSDPPADGLPEALHPQSESSDETTDIVIRGEDGTPNYTVKLSRTHTTSSQSIGSHRSVITTRHAISAEILASPRMPRGPGSNDLVEVHVIDKVSKATDSVLSSRGKERVLTDLSEQLSASAGSGDGGGSEADVLLPTDRHVVSVDLADDVEQGPIDFERTPLEPSADENNNETLDPPFMVEKAEAGEDQRSTRSRSSEMTDYLELPASFYPGGIVITEHMEGLEHD